MAPSFTFALTLLATISACSNVVEAASRGVPSSILYSQSNDGISEKVLAKGLSAALPASLALGFDAEGKLFETGNLVSRARLNVLVFAAVSEDELVGSHQSSSVLPEKHSLPSSEDALHLGQLACSFIDLYPQSRVSVVADAANALPEGLPAPRVVSASQALEVSNDSSLNVWLPQVDGDSENAIELAVRLISASLRDGSSQQGNSPDMLVLLVSGKDAGTKVFKHVSAINDNAIKQYGRINMKFVLVNQRDSRGSDQVVWAGRRLQNAEKTSAPTAADPTTPLGEHDVIMIWMSIVVLIVVFVVFCCVGWSSELDPLLNTGFKSESSGLKID